MYRPSFGLRLQTITESTIENALVLKETLEAKGLRSPVFADICQVIEDRAKGVINQVTD